jgi:hypothetical protein
MIPPTWLRYNKTSTKPDFVANLLKPNFIAPIRWFDGTRDVVTPHAFRIGLNPKIRTTLLEYANRLGITNLLKYVTAEGNGLLPDTDTFIQLSSNNNNDTNDQDQQQNLWQLQRPGKEWQSNLHWLSPANSMIHENYLQALSVEGFDEVLNSLGQYLVLDGLAVFHITFIAVSYGTKGYIHRDFEESGNKAFNIIIPLLLSNETDPELVLRTPDRTRIGQYQSEYDVAVAIGDQADHGTSAVNYRWNQQMRLAATIYIADSCNNLYCRFE